MKYLITLSMIFVMQVSQAETSFDAKSLNEMTFKTSFQEERGEFRLWNENGKFFIEHSGNSDRSPSEVRKSELTPDQVSFLKTKLDELKTLKDSPVCENRGIIANYKIGEKTYEHKGCIDSKDKISTHLNQLSSIMMILI